MQNISWLFRLFYLSNPVADMFDCPWHLLHTLLPCELEEGWSSVCLWSWLPDHTSRNTGYSTETSLPILHQLIWKLPYLRSLTWSFTMDLRPVMVCRSLVLRLNGWTFNFKLLRKFMVDIASLSPTCFWYS